MRAAPVVVLVLLALGTATAASCTDVGLESFDSKYALGSWQLCGEELIATWPSDTNDARTPALVAILSRSDARAVLAEGSVDQGRVVLDASKLTKAAADLYFAGPMATPQQKVAAIDLSARVGTPQFIILGLIGLVLVAIAVGIVWAAKHMPRSARMEVESSRRAPPPTLATHDIRRTPPASTTAARAATPAPSVQALLTLPDGTPLAGIRVHARRISDRQEFILGETGADGTTKNCTLGSGEYRMTLAGPPGQLLDLATEPFTAPPSRPGPIQGTVTSKHNDAFRRTLKPDRLPGAKRSALRDACESSLASYITAWDEAVGSVSFALKPPPTYDRATLETAVTTAFRDLHGTLGEMLDEKPIQRHLDEHETMLLPAPFKWVGPDGETAAEVMRGSYAAPSPTAALFDAARRWSTTLDDTIRQNFRTVETKPASILYDAAESRLKGDHDAGTLSAALLLAALGHAVLTDPTLRQEWGK